MHIRKPIFWILIACAGIELLQFLWLCFLGREAFIRFIWAPDTSQYDRLALHLAETFTLAPNQRTLGYPLFLALGYLIGGRNYGIYLIIAVQLVLNLVFTWGCWRLLERIVPAAGVRLRASATLFFFWAGLGMAFYLLTDFVASLFFGVFIYGLLFWRTPSTVFLSGASLALATLTRPTFTLFPFLLPIVAYLIGRFTSKVPWYYLVAFTTCSLATTAVSVVYQYTNYKYIGPSSVVSENIEDSLADALAGGDREAYENVFEAEIEKRAGRPYATLSLSEQAKYAKQVFRAELGSHPSEIMTHFVKTFLKLVVVPVEANVRKWTAFYASERGYFTYLRPILGLACLPIWLLSLIPPIDAPKNYRMYYRLMVVLLVYIVGVSVVAGPQGERMRFPVLVFMLPVMVWNVNRITSLRGRRD